MTPGSMLGRWKCIGAILPALAADQKTDRRPKAPVQKIRRAACDSVHNTA
jgi:hypothetical protein